MSRLLRRLFAPRSRPAAATTIRALGARLLVAPLEDRLTPAGFVVTNANDNGPGSLRAALTSANAAATNDTITFNLPAGPQTISLVTALPAIANGDLDLVNAAGAGNLTVQRSTSAGANFGIFSVGTSANVTFDGLTITGGTGGPGGAITAGTQNVTVKNSVLTGNTGAVAGAIYVAPFSTGLLTIQNTTISGNTGLTGGIYFWSDGSLLMQNTTVSNNRGTSATFFEGGGLLFFGAVGAGGFTVDGSTFSGNVSSSVSGGGGISFVQASGSATSRNSTFDANSAVSAGGGSAAGGGGAIAVVASFFDVDVLNSTFVGNTADGVAGGGAIGFDRALGTFNLQNSTLTGNTAAAGPGGGVGGVIAYTTSSGNYYYGTLNVVSCIISGNTDGTGTSSDVGSNLREVNLSYSAVGSAGFTLGTDVNNLPLSLSTPAALQLGTLQNNGGTVATVEIGPTSSALDKGANPAGLTTDARGAGFPREFSPAGAQVADIGAYEQLDPAIPPTLTLSAAGSTVYFENAPPVVLDPGLSVTDDGTFIQLATVTITSGFTPGQDVLGFSPVGAIFGTYNSATGVLTLSGIDTLANYQAALRSVTFAATGDNPAANDRTMTFRATDTDGGVSAAQSLDVSVVPVNDAPVNAVPAAAPVVIAGATGPAAGLRVADPDANAGKILVTVSVPAGLGTFAFATVPAGATVTGSGTGVISITANLTDVNTALASLTYTAPATTPQPVTATIATNDKGNTGAGGSLTDTDTFTIVIGDQPPTLAVTGGTVTYTEDGPPVAVDAGIAPGDNGALLSGAAARIAAGYDPATDSLTFTPQGNVTGFFNPVTGTLTLGGDDTLAVYQAVLQSVSFAAGGDNPAAGTRAVEFVVFDRPPAGVTPGRSPAGTDFVDVAPVNDAPTAGAPAGPLTTAEETALTIGGVTVTDPDSANVTVTLSVANGRLQVTPGGSSVTGNGTANVTVSGPLAAVSTTLAAGIVYTPAVDFSATDTLTVVASDGQLASGVVTVDVDVTPVNDAPALAGVVGTTAFQLGRAPVAVAPAALVTDVDSPDFAGGTLTVVLSGGQAGDVIAVQNQGTNPGQIGVIAGGTSVVTYGGQVLGFATGGTGGTPLTVTLTAVATPAAAQALARAVTFTTPTAGAVLGNRSVGFTVTDGAGGTSNTDSRTVGVGASTAPVVTFPSGGTVTYTEGDAPAALDAAATVSDADTTDFAGGTLTVDFTAGAAAGDRLVVADAGVGAGQIGVSGSTVLYEGAPVGTLAGGTGGAPLVVTLGPGSTPAAVQQLVRSVSFAVPGDNPVAGVRSVRVRLDDGGLGTSAAVTAAVTVVPVNDAPVVTAPIGVLATPENTNLTITGVSVADPDAGTSRVQVTVVVAGGAAILVNVPNVTVTGNGSAAVTAVGTVANLTAALNGMLFLPASNFNGFATVRVTANDLGASPAPALTDAKTVTIGVGSVNQPPVNTLPAGPLATNEDTPLTVTGLAVADVDAGTAAIRVTLSAANGTVQVRTTVVGGVTAAQVSGNGTAAVTIDAPQAAINAALAAGAVYTPAQDFFGTDALTVTTNDLGNAGGTVGIDIDPVAVVVSPLNDAPTFTVTAPTVTVTEDTGTVTVANVVANASAGPADEAAQTLTWAVSVASANRNLAFTTPPTINPATGALTFTVAPDTNGTATLNLSLTDSGSGTAPNANATTKTVTVVVNAVNDAPSFTLAGNPPAANQNGGPQAVAGFVTAFQRGPAAATDELSQTPLYLLTQTGTTGNLAFTSGPAINAAGTLSYTPALGTFGTATFSVRVKDSGGTANGGQDTSLAQTFTVTVNQVFTPPTVGNDTARIPQGSPATTVDVLANDAPAAGTAGGLSVTAATPGANGAVAIGANGANVSYRPAAGFSGTDSFTYTVTDANGATATATVQVTVPALATAYNLVAVGSVSDSRVTVYDASTRKFVTEFFAFGPTFPGGVKVAVGDVNGDGTADVIVGAGLGGAPHVKVIDGTKLGTLPPDGSIPDTALIASFFAFDPTVRGGVFVAAGDVNGDGRSDVIVSPGIGGGPHVKVIDGTDLGPAGFGVDGQPLASSLLGSFFAYDPNLRNGLSVSSADVNNDGYADVITGSGPGGAPHVKVIDGTRLALSDAGQPARDALLYSFFAYPAGFTGGVHVTGGDLDGDGRAEVIVSAGTGGGPEVRVYDGRTGRLRNNFNAFDSTSNFGLDVAYRLRADGVPTLAVSELGGIGRFRNYAGPNLDPVEDVTAVVSPFLGGIEVG